MIPIAAIADLWQTRRELVSGECLIPHACFPGRERKGKTSTARRFYLTKPAVVMHFVMTLTAA